MKKITDTIVILGPVRFSYLNAFKARMNNIRKVEEFSAVLLIPKAPNDFNKDPLSLVKDIREVIETALKEKFKDVPKKYETCLFDGDTETDNEGEPKHPGYWFISTRSSLEYPPVLIDAGRKPVVDAAAWVSGDWGYAKVSFYGYEFEGKKGVSTSLRAIQFTRKDEPFGANQDPEAVAAEFDDVEADFLA
jgi:hypothetical protein